MLLPSVCSPPLLYRLYVLLQFISRLPDNEKEAEHAKEEETEEEEKEAPAEEKATEDEPSEEEAKKEEDDASALFGGSPAGMASLTFTCDSNDS